MSNPTSGTGQATGATRANRGCLCGHGDVFRYERGQTAVADLPVAEDRPAARMPRASGCPPSMNFYANGIFVPVGTPPMKAVVHAVHADCRTRPDPGRARRHAAGPEGSESIRVVASGSRPASIAANIGRVRSGPVPPGCGRCRIGIRNARRTTCPGEYPTFGRGLNDATAAPYQSMENMRPGAHGGNRMFEKRKDVICGVAAAGGDFTRSPSLPMALGADGHRVRAQRPGRRSAGSELVASLHRGRWKTTAKVNRYAKRLLTRRRHASDLARARVRLTGFTGAPATGIVPTPPPRAIARGIGMRFRRRAVRAALHRNRARRLAPRDARQGVTGHPRSFALCLSTAPHSTARSPAKCVWNFGARRLSSASVTDAQATRWLASARRRTATGAECAHRPHWAPSRVAPQRRCCIRAFEGASTAIAPGAGVAGCRRNTRRRPRAAGPMPVEHRGCRKRHFHSRRRVDSQVGARHGSRGRRRGR